jgi:multiple sugar transport system permease protein
LSTREQYVLAIGMAMRRDEFTIDWGDMMAISFLVTIVPLLVFFFAQKYFIRGIAMTGIKA